MTVHAGRKLPSAELECTLAAWIDDQRYNELAVSTQDIIDKALSIDATFLDADGKRLFYWVHQFMRRNHFGVRIRTRVSQQTQDVMESGKREHCRRVMTTYHNHIDDPRLLVNMDETAVYLNASPKRTVHRKGERTVSIRIGGSSSMRFTLAVIVAMDGTKLPLFVGAH